MKLCFYKASFFYIISNMYNCNNANKNRPYRIEILKIYKLLPFIFGREIGRINKQKQSIYEEAY